MYGGCGESSLTFSEEDPNDPTDWDRGGYYNGGGNKNCDS